jgi:hypothetical protein
MDNSGPKYPEMDAVMLEAMVAMRKKHCRHDLSGMRIHQRRVETSKGFRPAEAPLGAVQPFSGK